MIKDGKKTFYLLRDSESLSLIKMPTKYLKHKLMENNSPNTVRRIAYTLSYYLEYLKEKQLTEEMVLCMKYAEQYSHFVDFLYWLKSGKHCNRKELPRNNTCNAYLEVVFGFYHFIILQYETNGELKILEERTIDYSGDAGVRFQRNINTFKGYLKKEETRERIITKEQINVLLDACDNLRNRLLLQMLIDTGFRIGELLAIRYTKDIDFDTRTIKVVFRDDNENGARAKYAEERHVKISPEPFECLLIYMSRYKELLSNTDYLFVTLVGKTAGKAMTANAVYSMLKTLTKKTNIAITPHMLRHYHGSVRYEDGWTLDKLAYDYGHKSIRTTEQYLHVDDNRMLSAMDEYFASHGENYNIDKLI